MCTLYNPVSQDEGLQVTVLNYSRVLQPVLGVTFLHSGVGGEGHTVCKNDF